MLGFRGCRLAIAYPEIAEMQARAIFEAAVEAGQGDRRAGEPEIMVPLVVTKARARPRQGAHRRHGEGGRCRRPAATVDYQVGTMIELPRAACRPARSPRRAEFFSFGTNDLTQTALGISRDDAATFLGAYTQKGILTADPFVTIDQEGVGELVAHRRRARPGGAARPQARHLRRAWRRSRPRSRFCHEVGLDYVSCSPYRVPIARLAAAQAALATRKD